MSFNKERNSFSVQKFNVYGATLPKRKPIAHAPPKNANRFLTALARLSRFIRKENLNMLYILVFLPAFLRTYTLSFTMKILSGTNDIGNINSKKILWYLLVRKWSYFELKVNVVLLVFYSNQKNFMRVINLQNWPFPLKFKVKLNLKHCHFDSG